MTTKSAKVREQLDHPVIDADGHWVELFPIFFDYIAEVGSAADVDTFRARYGHRFHGWYELTVEERRQRRLRRPSYWGVPINVRDRAATALPGLFYDSLDSWGIDLAIVFPSVGLTLGRDIADPELSNVALRAYNTMVADLFSPYLDRMVPVGVLSLADPTEAIEQMEHADSLGLQVLVTGGTIPRTIEADAEWQPDPAKRRVYIDALGVDSAYDYDPVWQRFIDLGIPVTSHSGSMGWPDRSLSSSFVGNHLGHFAQSHHTFARSLFLGGVTERFPTLNFGFLEGGVGWACNLYGDLFGHWEKRNRKFMDEHLKPTNLDTAEFRRLYEQYTAGNPRYTGKIDDIVAQNLDALESDTSQAELTERDLDSDDFARVHIDGPDDIRRLFAEPFYFGCEADDPMTSIAFDDRMGLRLKPLLGSDIAHFDVIDATEVLEEAHELVDDGHITEHDFREFTFSNVVQLYRGMNPEFFRGTVVEAEAEAEFAKYYGEWTLTYETIVIERRGHTACIRLDRPEVLNAINDEMIAEINQAAAELEADADVWTIVLTGTGRALCSGADVNKAGDEEKGNYTRGLDPQGEELLSSARQWDAPQEATLPYLEMTKPTICAVNGICAGAGLDLVTTSDIVIASDDATFFDPHVSIGVVSGREALRLARVLPLNITMRLALMGKHERLSVQRAYDLGLVSEIVARDALMDRAWEIADVVNRNAPLAVRGTRLAIRKTLSLPTYEAELLAENYRMKVAVTDDAQEGARAFLEKRDPDWKVR